MGESGIAYAPYLEAGRRPKIMLNDHSTDPHWQTVASMPYWAHGRARMYHGDARRLPLADESVHLIVTSPPYNARIRYRGYHDWQPWADYWDGLIVPSLREMYRVLVPGGRACINFANVISAPQVMVKGTRHNPRRPSEVKQWAILTETVLWPALLNLGFLPRERLTWVKSEAGETIAPSTAWGSWLSPSNPVLRAVAEPIFIVSKGTYDRYSAVPSPIDHDDFMAWTRNVWYIAQDSHKANPFPARFPLELASRLVKLYSFRYDTVLDPFGGSGTTLLAASDAGRQGVAVEQGERYVINARARYRKHYFITEAADV